MTGKNLVAPGARDHHARADGGNQRTDRSGQEQEAGEGRGQSRHRLHEQGQVVEHPERCHAHKDGDGDSEADRAVAQQVQGQNGFGRAPLDQNEAGKGEQNEGRQHIGKGSRIAASEHLFGPEHQRRHAARKEQAAEIIDRRPLLGSGPGHGEGNHAEGQNAHRHVDEENVLPAHRLGDKAAGDRTDQPRKGEHGRGVALIAGALARLEQIGKNTESGGHQTAAAEPLQHAPPRSDFPSTRRARRRTSPPRTGRSLP